MNLAITVNLNMSIAIFPKKILKISLNCLIPFKISLINLNLYNFHSSAWNIMFETNWTTLNFKRSIKSKSKKKKKTMTFSKSKFKNEVLIMKRKYISKGNQSTMWWISSRLSEYQQMPVTIQSSFLEMYSIRVNQIFFAFCPNKIKIWFWNYRNKSKESNRCLKYQRASTKEWDRLTLQAPKMISLKQAYKVHIYLF